MISFNRDLRNLGGMIGVQFPKLLDDATVRALVRTAMEDAAPEPSVAAIRLALSRPGLATEKALRTALDRPLPEHRIALLASIAYQRAQELNTKNVSASNNRAVVLLSTEGEEEWRQPGPGTRRPALDLLEGRRHRRLGSSAPAGGCDTRKRWSG